MKTIADKIHAEQYREVKKAVLAISAGNRQEAKHLVESVAKRLSSTVTTPEDVQTLFFIDALNKYLDEDAFEAGNLYLMPENNQKINMFGLMAKKFPIVKFSQDIVNAIHAAEVHSEKNITILDIGIGSGQQIARLIEQIAAIKPDKLTVIGIEPAQESLAAAKILLEEWSENKQMTFAFKGIPKAMEEFDEQDWCNLEKILAEMKGKLMINASFALHHIRPVSFRSRLFTKLKQLKPAVLAVIEPYADFLTPDFEERFDNAWHHYGLTFGAIDDIDATIEEKNAMKKIFFSQEIEDVLSEDHLRTEQFETAEMWSERFLEAGFELCPQGPETIEHRVLDDYPFMTVTCNSRFTSFNIKGFPVVSILIGRTTA